MIISKKVFIIIITFFILIYFIYYSIEKKVETSNDNITNNGFIFFDFEGDLDGLNPLQKQTVIKDTVLSKLPHNYEFLDYYYYIKGCSLSTYHRDVTSGQRYMKSSFPTYTAIIYEYEGDFLSICPNSHKQYPFIWSRPLQISGKKNTVVVFDSDMLHAGIINRIGNQRKVLQYKIVHKNDRKLFTELNKVAVEKNSDCNMPVQVENILRFASYHMAWFCNGVAYPLLQKKYEDNIIQKSIPISFYNNS